MQSLENLGASCERLYDARVVVLQHSLVQVLNDSGPCSSVAAAMWRAKEDYAGSSFEQGGCSLVPAVDAVLESPAERLLPLVSRKHTTINLLRGKHLHL